MNYGYKVSVKQIQEWTHDLPLAVKGVVKVECIEIDKYESVSESTFQA